LPKFKWMLKAKFWRQLIDNFLNETAVEQ
jgi:hypothetical protein